MAKTASDLIKASLRKIGVIAAGETPSASEIQDGLDALQGMLDSWSTNDLLPVSETEETFSLVADQSEYTMGSGGDFDTSRPTDIIGINFVDSNDTELPLNKLTLEQWRNIGLRTFKSTIPTDFYFRTGWPLAKLFFYPVPSEVKNIKIFSRKPFLTIANSSTEIDLPGWFNDAIIYNLAVELADEYGRALSQNILIQAQKKLSAIESQNLSSSIPYACTDKSLMGDSQRTGWTLADFLKGGG